MNYIYGKRRKSKTYIEDQIKTTGFTTEIDVIEKLESKKWNCVAPFNYWDRDEKK